MWEHYLVDILLLLAAGKTMDRTAVRLGLSLGQTKRFLDKAFRAYGVTNRNGLMHIACCEGLLPPGQPRVTSPQRDLKPQEIRVLHGLASGNTYPEIGQDMCLSPHTITTYVKRALYARGAATAAQLVYLSHQDGLLGSGAPNPAGEAADV